MYVPDRNHRSRRLILVAGGTFLAGCTFGYTGVPSSVRKEILDSYSSGLEARNSASKAWVEGNGAWEGNFFRAAASHWERADDSFDSATNHFKMAEEGCVAAGADDAVELCTSAWLYCASMRDSATAHAKAAEEYAAGRLEAVEEQLSIGFDHYPDALDHEIPRASALEAALD